MCSTWLRYLYSLHACEHEVSTKECECRSHQYSYFPPCFVAPCYTATFSYSVRLKKPLAPSCNWPACSTATDACQSKRKGRHVRDTLYVQCSSSGTLSSLIPVFVPVVTSAPLASSLHLPCELRLFCASHCIVPCTTCCPYISVYENMSIQT